MSNNADNMDSVPTRVTEALEGDEDFFSDGVELDTKKINAMDEPKVIPSYSEKQLHEYEANLDTSKLATGNTEDQVSAYMIQEDDDEQRRTNPDNVGYREDIKGFTNKPSYKDVNLSLRQLVLTKRAKTPSNALLMLGQKTGIGGPIHIPLYHSGFWVTIKPLVSEEIVNLEFEIISELKRVGKLTNTLIFSHYNVIFAEIIFKYFKRKVIETSVDMGDNELEDLVSVNDLYVIALNLAKGIFPNGFNAIIPCKNNVVLNENKVPTCNVKISKHLDLTELLYVNTSLLTEEQLTVMAKKAPRSVTIEEVIAYQEDLNERFSKVNKYTNMDDEEFVTNLKVPNVARYFYSGHIYVEEIKTKCNELVMSNSSLDEDTAEKTLLALMKLNSYNHFIDNIPMDVNITELSDVNKALDLFSVDTLHVNKILDDIHELMDTSLVSIVGIPSFKCRSCNAVQSNTELIPLAVYEYFFILLHSKYQKILKQLEKQNKR